MKSLPKFKKRNAARADRGCWALLSYMDCHPDAQEIEDESLLNDLFSDLLHYAQSQNKNPELALMMGYINFNAER